MDRPTDQEIKDRQNSELEEERRIRRERLGHEVRDDESPEPGPSKNNLEALT